MWCCRTQWCPLPQIHTQPNRVFLCRPAPQDASHQLERWQQDIVDLGHEKRGVETELAAAEAACAEHMAQVGAGTAGLVGAGV